MALQLQEKVWGHTLLQNVLSFTATCVDDNLQSVSKETIPAQVPILTSAFCSLIYMYYLHPACHQQQLDCQLLSSMTRNLGKKSTIEENLKSHVETTQGLAFSSILGSSLRLGIAWNSVKICFQEQDSNSLDNVRGFLGCPDIRPWPQTPTWEMDAESSWNKSL